MDKKNQLKHFEIDDPLESSTSSAIEVTVTFTDGTRRWCFFTTPQALANYGDWIDGTTIRFHFGARHMIVIAAELTEEIIGEALRTIDQEGDLWSCTLALDGSTK